jgi:hypothetical protein
MHAFAQEFEGRSGLIRVGPAAKQVYDPYAKAIAYLFLDPVTAELLGAWERFGVDETRAVYRCLAGLGATRAAVRRIRDGQPHLHYHSLLPYRID